ncbi:Snf7-domain-containing protein [Suillus subaureus]|uniref:Snf7-domain-containing protein n=1 Tax=Suillus subaureus TaxID=48587 RepID=A0A9P7EQ03_9AGAM|nr:Snf7-domain-containing protein [Suillus subaureus]KAG1827170.1 Snf7-domain-containing protein [Suillus subaureus]
MSSLALSALPSYVSTSKSRLHSLYSDIHRQKHSNPSSFHAYVDWWHGTLKDFISRGWQGSDGPDGTSNKLILGARRTLVDKLRYEGVGKPLGLGTTIAEMQRSNDLVLLSQFLTSQQSVYDPGWFPYRIASFVVGKPLWWAMEQLDIVRSEDSYTEAETWKKIEGDYVMLGLVVQAADTLETLRDGIGLSPADNLYTFEDFRREFGVKVLPGVVLSEIDTKVLIKFLEREKRVVIQNGDVIKFVTATHDREITAVDRGILQLKTAVRNLHEQVDSIQNKIDQTTSNISNALRQQRKSIALAELRFKKHLDDLLSKRLGSLNNLESTLISVETAAGDVEIMKTYESSTATLKAILSHPSLQRDKIEETMDALATSTADAREIDDAIRMGGDMAAVDTGIDDMELEAELNALVEETEKERAEAAEQVVVEKLHGIGVHIPEGAPIQAEGAPRRMAEAA